MHECYWLLMCNAVHSDRNLLTFWGGHAVSIVTAVESSCRNILVEFTVKYY